MQRFADNNNVTLKEANRLLTEDELEEFHWSLAKYTEYASDEGLSELWAKELENASLRVRISRQEALLISIQHSYESLFNEYYKTTHEFLTKAYKNGYYDTAFEIHKGHGVAWKIASVDDRKLNKALSRPWGKTQKNFSERIWGQKEAIINTLHDELSNMMSSGIAPDKAIKNIAKQFNATKHHAGTLVMTESAFIHSAAQNDCYDELEVEEYRIVAVLDLKTSDKCRNKDGDVHKQSEWNPPYTAPPFHANCRTTTIPHFADNYISRVARGIDGKTYNIKGDITYDDWIKTYVGDEEHRIARKKDKNRFTDKDQHKKYRLIYGDKIPQSFQEFQNLKYHNPDKWGIIKAEKQSVLNGLDYKPSWKQKFGNGEVRGWYKSHCDNIPGLIDGTKSAAVQSKQGFNLRNKYKLQAREMMSDVKGRAELDQKYPIVSYEAKMKDKMRKKGLTEAQAKMDIAKTASKTNKKVNEDFGLE